ncbi:MAG: 50S ribosomal protein L21e [Candidatus Diapherotrites archaeon]
MAGKKARGWRAKSRAKITSRGNPTVTTRLRTYKEGETVQIVINGRIHSGMPFRRFHGLTGNVVRMQGKSVIVNVQQGSQWCELVVNPVHLKSIEQRAMDNVESAVVGALEGGKEA